MSLRFHPRRGQGCIHCIVELAQCIQIHQSFVKPLQKLLITFLYLCQPGFSKNSISVNFIYVDSVFPEDLLPFGFPSIDMGPQLKVVERTKTATMLCAASGIPDPEISWFKDFLPVDPGNSQGRIKQLRSGEVQ